MLHWDQRLVSDVARTVDLPKECEVLDIGANVGQFAVALLTLRPGATITSLEPNPTALRLLSLNSQRARDHGFNWQFLPIGLDSHDGDRTLWFVDGHTGQSSFRADVPEGLVAANKNLKLQSTRARCATAQTLMSLIPKLPNRWDLVKVDIEGWEAEVLPQIARLPFQFLCIEVRRQGDQSLTAEQVTAILAKNGCSCAFVGVVGADAYWYWDRRQRPHDLLFRNLG